MSQSDQKDAIKAALYEPKGKIVKTKSGDTDLEIYAVGSGTNALCIFYDVFGWQNLKANEGKKCPMTKSKNVFEFADMISSCSNGKYMVFMPNYLRNTPYTLDPKWGNEFATWWDTIGNLDKTINEFTKVVLPFIKKEYKITNICTLGQCWGGKLSILCGGKTDLPIPLNGVIACHPAKLDAKDFENLKVPVYMVQTKGDFDKDKAKEIISTKTIASYSDFEFNKNGHGFTAAGGKYNDKKWVIDNILPVLSNVVRFIGSSFYYGVSVKKTT